MTTNPNDLLSLYSIYAKSNPVVAGLIGLFGMSLVTFFLVKVPSRVWHFMYGQCTTSLSFNNALVGNGLENFSSFMSWFNDHHWSNWSRSYAMDGAWLRTGVTVGPGNGNHLFFWKGRLCWLNRRTMNQQGSGSQINVEVKVTMLGRNRKLLMQLIEDFRYKPPMNKVGIYYYYHEDWARIADVPQRSLDSTITMPGLKEDIVDRITKFQKSGDWYHDKGLPYKLSFLLFGSPGTGKTSLIKGIASHFQMNLAVLNLCEHTDRSLAKAIQSLPDNTMVAMEDFDSSEATHRRSFGNGATRALSEVDSKDTPASPNDTWSTKSKESTKLDVMSMLTPAGLFNALDGLAVLDNTILFMTTNHVEIMDEALLRAGRIDKMYHVGPLEDVSIRQYIKLMYPSAIIRTIHEFAPMLGCDLQELYFNHQDDPEGFINALPLKNESVTPDNTVIKPTFILQGKPHERHAISG